MKFRKVLALSVAFTLIFICLPGFAQSDGSSKSNAGSRQFDADTLNQDPRVDYNGLLQLLDRLIQEVYVRQVPDDQKRIYQAAKGLFRSLGDPHSTFLTPDETKFWEDDMAGKFAGIGIAIVPDKGYLRVQDVFSGGPADKAGLKKGDYILKVDGQSIEGLSVLEATMRIRGEKDAVVILTVAREGEAGPIELKAVRGVIQPPDLHVSVSTEGGYPVIRIPQFGDSTFQELSTTVAELQKDKKLNGVIIDLRNNPGGLISTCAGMLSLWLDSDSVIWVAKGKTEEKRFTIGELTFPSLSVLKGVPTVVLVNGFSASASEIFAGVAQDYGFATVIGEKTYGKGSAQIIKKLIDGSSVHLTNNLWTTPKGRVVDKNGIMPDIVAEMPKVKSADKDDGKAKPVDPQLDRAIEFLRTGK